MTYMSYDIIRCAKPRVTQAMNISYVHVTRITVSIHKEPNPLTIDCTECQLVKL
jgi:hypothetical protein